MRDAVALALQVTEMPEAKAQPKQQQEADENNA
jgi:hypothetical protein